MRAIITIWAAITIASWLFGCTTTPQREACYAQAHADLAAARLEQCGEDWDTCPAREDLLVQHYEQQGACP